MHIFGRGGGGGRGLALVAAIGALVLVATACGGSPTTETAPAETDTAQEGKGELALVMDDFSFLPESLTVSAGSEVVLTIVNEGQVEHELMLGTPVAGGPEWETDLFSRLAPEVVDGSAYRMEGFEHEEGEEEGHGGGHGAEVWLDAGGQLTLRLTIPEDAVGEWEMGCYLPGHYEAGMYGTLTVQ